MPAKPKIAESAAALRLRAEKRIGKPATDTLDTDARRMLHELEVHQIELELQNTELRNARDEAETLLDQYTELYDFAPVGYFTLCPAGTIRRTNLTGSTIVGTERSKLIGRSFGMLLAPANRAAFKIFLEQVFASDVKQASDFELTDATRTIRFVNIEGQCSTSGLECSAMMQDITERKLAEEMTQRNAKLSLDISRRKVVEENMRVKRKEQSLVLRQARFQEKQLRDLSHAILNAQEEERKRISRELHDVIAQALVGINVHLEILVQGSACAPESLRKQIQKTQLLVKKALEIVHEFARNLRPTMLDDLGLIPTLQAYMKRFMEDTGIRVSLKAFAEIDQSTSAVRTVLYRIAQEALTNVARHSKASNAEVVIKSIAGVIRMSITDNGEGFLVSRTGLSKRKNQLGLIGMRERVEMIGGTFQVNSSSGGPTMIQVEIPAA